MVDLKVLARVASKALVGDVRHVPCCDDAGCVVALAYMASASPEAALLAAERAVAAGGKVRFRKDRAIVSDPDMRGRLGGVAAAVFLF